MNDDHVSDLRFDRQLAGELSQADAAEITAHVETCPTCAARSRELAEMKASFAARPLPIMFAAQRRRSRLAPIWIAAGAVVATAAILLLWLRSPEQSPGGGERTKGSGPVLLLTRGDSLLSSGDPIFPGDRLQAAYSTDRDGFGAVLSRDGAGTVSAYVADGDLLVALPAGTERSFPASTELDDVVGREVVHIVWCPTQQSLAPLLAAVKTEPMVVPAGCHVRSVSLEKRPR